MGGQMMVLVDLSPSFTYVVSVCLNCFLIFVLNGGYYVNAFIFKLTPFFKITVCRSFLLFIVSAFSIKNNDLLRFNFSRGGLIFAFIFLKTFLPILDTIVSA